jgi:hypothetical protein
MSINLHLTGTHTCLLPQPIHIGTPHTQTIHTGTHTYTQVHSRAPYGPACTSTGYRSRAILSGCAYNPTGRKWAPVLFYGVLHLEFSIVERTSALKVRRLIESSWAAALNSEGALQSELCLITRDYGNLSEGIRLWG